MCVSCVLALTSQFTLLRNNRSHEDRGARFGKLTNVVVSRNVVRKDLYGARSLLTRGLLARWSVKTEKHLRLRIVGNHHGCANHRRAHENDQRSGAIPHFNNSFTSSKRSIRYGK